jgi:hypothetical protein
MALKKSAPWLLLIHQIPPKPEALRVKTWRRLQQVGAVAIKQSVYAMPLSEQSREDLSWTLKAIIAGGGDGSICEARFVEGLTDEQIVGLFLKARASDYAKIMQEVRPLLAERPPEKSEGREKSVKGAVLAAKLQRRLAEVAAIDFFNAPERGTADMLLKELAARFSGQALGGVQVQEKFENLKGRIWVTRRNLFVDRVACGWLIRRFVDEEATFKFVAGPRYTPGPEELRFDMFEGEYTHEGDLCSFEVMIQRLGIEDRALIPMAQVVHDIDLKEVRYGRSETDGFKALMTGMVAGFTDDDQRMTEGRRLFESLYIYYQGQKGS